MLQKHIMTKVKPVLKGVPQILLKGIFHSHPNDMNTERSLYVSLNFNCIRGDTKLLTAM